MGYRHPVECTVLYQPDLDFQELWPLQMALDGWAIVRGVPLLKLEWQRSPRPALFFRVALDRETVARTLGQALPADLLVDVLLDGQSWTILRKGAA